MTEDEVSQLRRKIDAGVKAAVAAALEEHRRMGRSVVIERDGKIVHLSPDEIPTSGPTTNPTVNQKENGHVDQK